MNMSFLQREIDKIRVKLVELKSGEKYDQLYAALYRIYGA
jgi:hypothetical protein